MVKVAEAIEYAHQRRVIHRDQVNSDSVATGDI
jgi:hypothetical protein